MPEVDASLQRDDEPTILNPGRSRLRSGLVLRERFELQRVLGEGGMGLVFLAIDREVVGADARVAIKVLNDSFRTHPESLSFLRREATNARQLNHSNIMGVYHFDRDGDDIFIVMEYLRGQELNDFIRAHPQGIPLAQAWPLIKGCAEALAYMHAHHIVHSDFKPANVFVTEDGTAKVLDLGIARTLDEQLAAEGRTRFHDGSPLALTPQYASPDMFNGLRADPRDDLYALGCVSYELLTGRHPYDRRPAPDAQASGVVPARPAGLPRRQWRALQRLLAFERAERTPSAPAFIAEFAPDARSPASRYWPVATLAAVLLLVVVTAVLLREDPDARFIEMQLLEHRNRVDPSISDEQITRWLEQAAMSRQLGQDALGTGDLERGHYFLSGAPSSASWIYRQVLASARRDADKRTAAEGLLALSKSYLAGAAPLLEQGDADAAIDHACHGLRINDRDAGLRSLVERARAAAPDPDRVPCADLLDEMNR